MGGTDSSLPRTPQLTSIFAQTAANTVFLPINLEDVPVQALLDTGASVTATNSNFARKYLHLSSKHIKKCPVITLTIGNGSVIKTDSYTTLKIAVGTQTWVQRFYMIEHLAHNVILGLDFTRKTHLVYDIAENQVWFKNDPQQKINLVPSDAPDLKGLRAIMSDSKLATELQARYPTVLTTKLGCTNVITAEIRPLPGAVLPTKAPIYHVSPSLQNIMKSEIRKLRDQGVIVPSLAPSVAPCFLVPKKKTDPTAEQKYRLVVDYRNVNKAIESIDYPVPTIESLLNYLRGAEVFTICDLNQAYHQIKLTKPSQKYTTFKTAQGTFAFRRLPFGIQVGSQLLSSLMQTLFEDLHGDCVIWYLDDLVIYSHNKSDHEHHVRLVMDRLKKANLTINPEKCQFATDKLTFLGHEIHKGKLSIGKDRINDLLAIPPPQNQKQVAQFLGAVGFYAAHVPDLAHLAAPLNKLRRKNAKFDWTPQCQESYLKLRERLTNHPTLRLPDYNKDFHLYTDASTEALGAALCQESGGKLHAVAYAGRKLNKHEVNYSIYELEFASVLFALKRFTKSYLAHKKVNIYTDARAVATIMDWSNASARVARWIEQLNQYNYALFHVDGKKNSIADYLSRQAVRPIQVPLDELHKWVYFPEQNNDNLVPQKLFAQRHGSHRTSTTQTSAGVVSPPPLQLNTLPWDSVTGPPPFSPFPTTRGNPVKGGGVVGPACTSVTVGDELPSHDGSVEGVVTFLQGFPEFSTQLRHHQDTDPKIAEIKDKIINGGNIPNYFIKHGLVHHQTRDGAHKPVLPTTLVDVVFDYYHNTALGGHQGKHKTVSRINQTFYHPGMDVLIGKKVAQCERCARAKTQQYSPGQLSARVAAAPNETLFCDVVGPLPRTRNQNTHILVAIDGFAKYVWFIPMKKHTSQAIVSALQTHVFTKFGYYKEIVTDNASTFRSHLFQHFIWSHGMEITPLHTYYAAPNQAERLIKTLKQTLTCFHAEDHTQWDTELPYIQLGFNTAKHASTGYTPAKLFLGHELRGPLELRWDISLHENALSPMEVWRDAYSNLVKALAKRKKYYDARHTSRTYKLGDQVLIKTYVISSRANNVNAKLAHKYSVPYRVTKVLSPVTYELTNAAAPSDVRTHHVSQLKTYRTSDGLLQQN